MEKHSQERLTSEHILYPPNPRDPGLGTRNFGHYILRGATASIPGDSRNLPLQSHLHLHCLSQSISLFYVCQGTSGRELSHQDTTAQDAFPQGWKKNNRNKWQLFALLLPFSHSLSGRGTDFTSWEGKKQKTSHQYNHRSCCSSITFITAPRSLKDPSHNRLRIQTY